MRQIDNRVALRVDLVEDVVSEQAEEVPIPGLAPGRVPGVFGPVVDGSQLQEKARETPVLEFAAEFGGEGVVGVEGGIQRGEDMPRDLLQELIDALRLRLAHCRLLLGSRSRGRGNKPHDRIPHLRAIAPPELLHRPLDRIRSRRQSGMSRDTEDQSPERDEVFGLEVSKRLRGLEHHHVEDAACRQPDAVLIRQEDFTWFEASDGQIGGVDAFDCRRDLNDVVPKHGFCDS